MRNRFNAIFLCACVLALFSGCGDAPRPPAKTPGFEGVERTAEKGPVKLTVRVSPKLPRLSDTITLDLTLRSDPEIEVKPPAFGKGVREFTVRDYVELPAKLEDGKRVRRFRYRLEAEVAGKLLIRSQQVEYVDTRMVVKDAGKRYFIASEPIEITVLASSGDKEPDLNDLKPIFEPQPLEYRGLSWWMWLLIVFVLLTATAFVLWWSLRKKAEAKAAEIVRSPEEIARAELETLLKEGLAEKKEFKEFYVRLTGIVRQYIERKTGIHAPEQTTEEFLRDPATRQTFTFEKAERLGQFLEAADMVKYAAMEPGVKQLDESVVRAREFIGMSEAA